MFLGKVVGAMGSEANSGACGQSRLKIIQKLDLYRNATGHQTLAIDMLGAGDGDIVMVRPSDARHHNQLDGPVQSSESMIVSIIKREAGESS